MCGILMFTFTKFGFLILILLFLLIVHYNYYFIYRISIMKIQAQKHLSFFKNSKLQKLCTYPSEILTVFNNKCTNIYT